MSAAKEKENILNQTKKKHDNASDFNLLDNKPIKADRGRI